MAVMFPSRADPVIAAATFKQHLDQLWASGRPSRLGWKRIDPDTSPVLDTLHVVVNLPALRPSGELDHYYILLGAEYYDAAPPTVAIVKPDDWSQAPEKSKWFPVLEGLPSWIGLHASHTWPDGSKRQLVCFTFTAEYYMVEHAPKDSERWQQGRHTMSATLSRLAEVFSPKYYRGPSA